MCLAMCLKKNKNFRLIVFINIVFIKKSVYDASYRKTFSRSHQYPRCCSRERQTLRGQFDFPSRFVLAASSSSSSRIDGNVRKETYRWWPQRQLLISLGLLLIFHSLIASKALSLYYTQRRVNINRRCITLCLLPKWCRIRFLLRRLTILTTTRNEPCSLLLNHPCPCNSSDIIILMLSLWWLICVSAVLSTFILPEKLLVYPGVRYRCNFLSRSSTVLWIWAFTSVICPLQWDLFSWRFVQKR